MAVIRKRVKALKACDYGHEARIVRRLSLGGGSGIYLCRTHWNKEMTYRRSRNKKLVKGSKFPIRKFPA